MEYKYQVISQDEENPLQSVVEKSGGVVEFTVQDIINNLIHGKKSQKEIEGTLKIAEATKTNIQNTHPHIAEMSLEDLTAAYLYRTAVGTVTEAQAKLAELVEAIREDSEQLEAIKQQTGIVIPQEIQDELEQ